MAWCFPVILRGNHSSFFRCLSELSGGLAVTEDRTVRHVPNAFRDSRFHPPTGGRRLAKPRHLLRGTELVIGTSVYAWGVKPLPAEDLLHILEQTGPFWNSARGSRIFISGGTGFFGSWLLESLAYCNRECGLNIKATVLSRSPEAFLGRLPHLAGEPSIQWLKGDVRDFDIPEAQFDYIVHGAAPTTAHGVQQPSDLITTLVDGTKRVLDLTRNCDARSLLFLSSGAVYGKQPENLTNIPESYLGGPDWVDVDSVYAEGKRIAETMCAVLAKETKVPCTIARCFAFVGPHLPLDQHFAIGNFIADALAGRDIAIQSDGSPTRSYLYAADLAVWLWTLLFRGGEADTNPLVLNVGSRHAVSIRDLAREVVGAIRPGLKVVVAGHSATGAKRTRYVPEVAKAEAIFGLRQRIDLREAIRRTADWYC